MVVVWLVGICEQMVGMFSVKDWAAKEYRVSRIPLLGKQLDFYLYGRKTQGRLFYRNIQRSNQGRKFK